MAHQVLNHPEIGAAVEQVRCEAVPERVGMEPRVQSGLERVALDESLYAAGAQAAAVAIQEQRLLGRATLQGRTRMAKVFTERREGRSPEQGDPLFGALADDAEFTGLEIDIADVQGAATGTQPPRRGTICQLRRVRWSGRMGRTRRVGQGVDLSPGGDNGKPAIKPRRRDQVGMVAIDIAATGEEFVEGPEGGELAAHARLDVPEFQEPRQVVTQEPAVSPTYVANTPQPEELPERGDVRGVVANGVR